MSKKPTKKSHPELPEATLQAVRRRAEALAQPHQIEIHDVCFGPTDFGLTLSVIIKAAEGDDRAISVTDCEVVSRPLSKELDELMGDFPDNYMLEVTSVGIEEEEALTTLESTS